MGAYEDDVRKLGPILFWDKVRAARQMSPGDKVADGIRLFQQACQIMESAIRASRPGASDEEVFAEMKRRLAVQRQLEERGWTNLNE